MTAANYYPGRDGEIDLDGTTEAGAIARRLPDSRVVKASRMMAAAVMREHVDTDKHSELAVFVAGDDADAVAIVERLVRDAGFVPVVTGDLASGAAFEPDTEPYGAKLGEDEARDLIG